jgi:hypothetical protein
MAYMVGSRHGSPDDATLLVHELDRSALTVVRHTVAHHHVELALVVLDPQHHRHRLPDLDDPAHLAGVRTFAHLHAMS